MFWIKKDMELTPIQQFYEGQSVLITGGTGFVGKLLIHKLLTSCVHIHNIYVIIRKKKGEEYKQRHSALLSDKIFDNLRTISPNGLCVLEKVIPINGDVTEPGLGLCDQDRNLLCKEVSIVFHSAATLRFNEPLKIALTTNVIGTQNIVKLCKEIIGLKSLVHVSTSYSQSRNEYVEEKLSPPPIDINNILHLAALPDEKMLTELESVLLKTWPNTYCVTKNLAEHVINNSELPAVIIRPSIVASSQKYPTPGWVVSSSGAPNMLLLSSLGALHVLNGDNNTIIDLIPVDMVVNVMIVAAWRNARDRAEVIVYNIVSGNQNPILFGEYNKLIRENVQKFPPSKAIWYYNCHFIKPKLLSDLFSFFWQYLLFNVMNVISYLITGKFSFGGLYGRAKLLSEMFEPFVNHYWFFKDCNVQILGNMMSAEDKYIFNFDVSTINWNNYMSNFVIGIRTFALKDDITTLPMARKKYQRLYILHRLVQAIGVFVLYMAIRFIWKKSSLWTFVL